MSLVAVAFNESEAVIGSDGRHILRHALFGDLLSGDGFRKFAVVRPKRLVIAGTGSVLAYLRVWGLAHQLARRLPDDELFEALREKLNSFLPRYCRRPEGKPSDAYRCSRFALVGYCGKLGRIRLCTWEPDKAYQCKEAEVFRPFGFGGFGALDNPESERLFNKASRMETQTDAVEFLIREIAKIDPCVGGETFTYEIKAPAQPSKWARVAVFNPWGMRS